MKGRYAEAMKHLRRAEKIYRRIGDIVSYSYTIWSMGMIHVLKGRFRSAEDCFEEAARRFRKTKDVRGTIYCGLGLGELKILKGDKAQAKRIVEKALKDALKKGFALEACHARALLGYIAEGTINRRVYKGIGTKLSYGFFPFNIP